MICFAGWTLDCRNYLHTPTRLDNLLFTPILPRCDSLWLHSQSREASRQARNAVHEER